eukprot:TRINITY_DN25748_c0_g1_i2.p1 TRINITY_DN25748_c0_g1~~TRINITY_DN25748_c0_g1_i2.p1  ORF type:complete len:664 (+),score=100.67 TRINITY_DN25748_c0_g1_i2:53-2044(+)
MEVEKAALKARSVSPARDGSMSDLRRMSWSSGEPVTFASAVEEQQPRSSIQLPSPPACFDHKLEEIQEGFFPTESTSDSDIGAWLADTLQSERLCVIAVIEQRHEAILRNFHDMFDRVGGPHREYLAVSKDESRNSDQRKILESIRQADTRQSVACTPAIGDGGAISESGCVDSDAFEDCDTGRDKDYKSENDIVQEPLRCEDSTANAPSSWEDNTGHESPRLSGLLTADTVQGHAVELEHTHSKKLYDTESTNDFQHLYGCANICPWARNFVPRFELFMMAVIMLNMMCMALERQLTGIGIGYKHFRHYNYFPPDETWPWADRFFRVMERIVGTAYIAEVAIMLCIFRHRYFCKAWHLFDIVVVASWPVSLFSAHIGGHLLVLRTAKAARLLRLLRIVRAFASLEALEMISKSVASGLAILGWCMVLLSLVVSTLSLCVSFVLEGWIRDESHHVTDRLEVFEQWGTFGRSLGTMWEVTIGNWGPPCRLLQNKVNELWVVFFLAYKCIFGFAVIQIIACVFLQQTFKLVARDEKVMIDKTLASSQATLANLMDLFEKIDTSGSGTMSRDELELCLNNEIVRAWISSLDIDVSDASSLFSALCCGSDDQHRVNREEFIEGMRRLCRSAKRIEMAYVMKTVGRVDLDAVACKEKNALPRSPKVLT